MANQTSPEQLAAAANYERTIDPENKTTRRPLTVGYASMIHALDETGDIWGLKVGRLELGRSFAQALCGQRSPSYNQNNGRQIQDAPVKVGCSKCLKVMANIAANNKAKAEAASAENAPEA